MASLPWGSTGKALNGPDTIAFLTAVGPDLILSYGCHKLSPAVLACTGRYAWNVHGGLSPWYRGVTTHFWPSYLLEPQMTGMTLHETTDQLDGGAILHQTGVDMVSGDGLHDLAARAVQGFADDLPAFLRDVSQAPSPVTGIPQRTRRAACGPSTCGDRNILYRSTNTTKTASSTGCWTESWPGGFRSW